MESYKRGSHTVWDCKYHLVWVTKYRMRCSVEMWGSGAASCYARRPARMRWSCTPGPSTGTTCIMLLSIPPSLSVSRAVQYLKGRSSHKLLSEFASLRKRYWGQHLWAEATGLRAAAT